VPNLLGAIYTKQKRYEEAIQKFNQALLALDPKFYYPAKLNLGRSENCWKVITLMRLWNTRALKEVDPGSELVDFKLMLCALLSGEVNKASGLVDLMKFSRQNARLLLCSGGNRP